MYVIKRTVFSALFTCVFLFTFNTLAQENNKAKTTYIIVGAKANENIEKVTSDSTLSENHKIKKYSNGQYRWIDNYCFSVSEYDWQDAEINLQLDKTLEYRKKVNRNAIFGVTSAVLGLGINGFAQLLYGLSDDSNKTKPKLIVLPFVVSGGFFIGASINSNRKNKELAKLKQLRTR